MHGKIFDVKHFAVHDGPGIRTTVFFKGCPLKCIWCHNPESIRGEKEFGYIEHKCVHCGKCVSVCKAGAHSISDGIHTFDRVKCTLCGACVTVCPAKACTLYGKDTDVRSLVDELLEDRDFYESSNGGVTLSGGECLMQIDFCVELLKRIKEEGIHTAVDTCGFVSRQALDKIMEYTDLFLYDIKAVDADVHKKCTGQSNALILENLQYLDAKNKKIEVRYPYVPGYNSDQAQEIAVFLKGLSNITAIKVLPYHNYAGTKYKSLGIENTLPEKLPDNEEMQEIRKLFKSCGLNVSD